MEIISQYFSDFTDTQKQQFDSLKSLYEEWNQKINVISRKDLDNFYVHHVLHSLAIATRFDFKAGYEIMDLGCGGGFPGIPLAIFYPEVNFLLVDSINKKLNVVNAVANELGLSNVKTLHSRAEDIKDKKFDVVVSRAVAPLKDLWYWSRPLIKKNKTAAGVDNPNGLICLKGGDLSQEIFESGCKPFVWNIGEIFPVPYFGEKFLLYQPVK
jgi:16S rRNA (guanine527-N7)-methyltransferase